MTRLHDERRRRWRLALGGDEGEGLSERDLRIDRALAALYDRTGAGGRQGGRGRRGGLGASAPRVSRWLGDIREFFPAPVVQVIQRDAFERLGLKAMLMEPEFLATLEADVHLVADLIGLRAAMPAKAKDTARQVVRKVVDELMAKLAHRTAETIRGAVDRARRTSRPRPADIDWPRTIRANLDKYQPDLRTVIPERLIGYRRHSRARVDIESVVLCVDQSGSMATSVVYSSIFAAVMASLPAIATQLVCFDTAILDLTDELADPVDVLFGVQLGGGTDINAALAYCETRIAQPARTHLVLISDLYEGGNAAAMLGRAASLVASGVNLIVLLALSDDGRPGYDANHAGKLAALGCPVFACTPDQFPDLMAAALRRDDIADWAAARDIALVRASA
jgi:Mg-chelatase subunit ChlD